MSVVQRPDAVRVLRPCGDVAVLVELASLEDVLALHASLAADTPPGVVDLVPAARTLLVRVRERADLAAVAPVVRDRPVVRRGILDDDDATGSPVTIPVRYDGEDLGDVAAAVGLTPETVVAAHTGQTWTVAFTGFAPGFGYLVGENDALTVGRREVSRARVPAGAVGLAGSFSGVYPRESPGGWQLIGTTTSTMWDAERTPPALLTPGTRVWFEEVR